jgi:RNA polymerase sigma-70 factor, ECF subfamily
MAAQARRDDSEAALLSRVLQGDHEAFPRLLRPYERTVFLIARVLCTNDREAESLAEQSMVTAFRELAYIPGNVRFGAWLARIVIGESVSGNPALTGTQSESADYTPRDLGQWQEIPAQALEDPNVREVLMGELVTLPVGRRLVLVLRDVEKFTNAEVAWILGTQADMIQKTLLCARLQMRDAVAAGMNGNWKESSPHPKKRTTGDTDEMRRNLA